MEQEITSFFSSIEEKMQHTCDFLSKEYSKVKAGRANLQILDGLKVESYGEMVPLNQVSTLTTPDARTILIKPWDKKSVSDIEKAIQTSKLDLVPQNKGDEIILPIPPLSEERRLSIVKQIKAEAEKEKISIRNVRKNAKDELKKLKKNGASEDDIKKYDEKLQKLTDKFIAKIDSICLDKERDIMKV